MDCLTTCGRLVQCGCWLKKSRVSYSERYVAKLLRRWGFTAQKPAFVAYEQSPAAVRRWLTEEYPAIRRRAQKQRSIVFWGDEAGMRSNHQAGTTYAPKGKTPVVKKSGQHFSLNMISAISNRGQLVFMVVDGRFNSEV